MDGLLGYSIGAISKDIRYFLDKLLEQFPAYFRDTVVDVHKRNSVVSVKWQAFNKDLMKWRWKLIKKSEAAAANKDDQVRDAPEDHLAVVEEEYYDPLQDEDEYITLLADDDDSDNESPMAFSRTMVDDDNDDDVQRAGAAGTGDDHNDESDQGSSSDDGMDDDRNPAAVQRKRSQNKRRQQPRRTTEIYKPPSKQEQKKVLGYDVSSSSNTDLYSTDEERLGKHKKKDDSAVRRQKYSFESEEYGSIEHQHCQECRGMNKVPHLVFEASADGVVMQKHAVKSAAWPLMGQLLYISPCIHLKHKVRFYMPRNSNPVIIGFFHGTTKPSCANSFLKCAFKEMKLANKRGLCTMFLKFYVGDGPSRNFIKGFPSSGAYCGCER
jgi:hypothetical protein